MAFCGEIKIFPYSYAPRDWIFCDGSKLYISQYSLLYATIGFTYNPGGNMDRDNFWIPNLVNRVPIGFNTSRTSFYQLGRIGGSDTATLNSTQFPVHKHNISIVRKNGTTTASTGSLMAALPSTPPVSLYKDYSSADQQVMMHPGMIQPTGSNGMYNTTHANVQPTINMHYCICIDGTYAPRP